MNAKECIMGRRSIRKFKSDAVSDDVLREIVLEASYAPSWKHSQIARYYIIKDEAKKAELAAHTKLWAGNGEIMKSAPAVCCVVAMKNRSGYERDGSFSTVREDRWTMFDAGVATQTFCLAAYEHGLGTVIMGLVDPDAGDVLNLPEDRELIAVVPIGYPDEEPVAPKRKAVEDLLTII
ncbi:MAG: nitroreductase family protein [Lachnospiraceae bacterium]|nr:nitroreductase family protein [Lachnospiraceae bacterium]